MIKKQMLKNSIWILCPVCRNKTRSKVREDTILRNYPLYCPKCKQETLISITDLKITVVKDSEKKATDS